jgi:predicted nucleic acid-binding protein
VLERGGVVSVQVLNECAVVLRRKARLDWGDIGRILADVRILVDAVLPLSAATHERALELAGQGGLSFYDALIVASALEAKATRLLSEDMQAGRRFETLELVNPFA